MDRLLTGIVAALRSEARTLGVPIRRGDGLSRLNDGTLVAVSGMGGMAAAAGARALVDAGASRLVSWGMAGGLDPRLTAGTVCLPSVVASGTASFATDECWREQARMVIAARTTFIGGHGAADGTLFTSAGAIDDPARKAALFRSTGAVAVDMESVAVAEVAARHGLPFIAVRVIVDTAVDLLPKSVLAASNAGQVRLLRLCVGLIRSPGDIAPLLRLARRYRAATRALAAVARSGALVPQPSVAAAMASATRIA